MSPRNYYFGQCSFGTNFSAPVSMKTMVLSKSCLNSNVENRGCPRKRCKGYHRFRVGTSWNYDLGPQVFVILILDKHARMAAIYTHCRASNCTNANLWNGLGKEIYKKETTSLLLTEPTLRKPKDGHRCDWDLISVRHERFVVNVLMTEILCGVWTSVSRGCSRDAVNSTQ